jgi:hypothetical protein
MDTFNEIGQIYQIDNDRTVKSVFVRMQKRIDEDKNLARAKERLQELIKRRQKWT